MIRDQVLSIHMGDKYRLAPAVGVLIEAMKFYGMDEDKRVLRRILNGWNFYISNELLKK